MQARHQRLCQMNGVQAGIGYALKGLIKVYPYSFLSISLVLIIIIPGYAIRIFERPLQIASGLDFNSLVNCFWYLIITLTTVGYGELSTFSEMGRFISVIIMIYGVFIMSLFVVTLTTQLEFSPGEMKSYNTLVRL
jgi:hypothetical protein